MSILDKVIGDLSEKKAYRENEVRAKKLPSEYAVAYKEIKSYLFHTSGILKMEPLVQLVDILEEAATDGKHVIDIIGTDVATFADELVRGEESYFEQQRKKLNDSMAKNKTKNVNK